MRLAAAIIATAALSSALPAVAGDAAAGEAAAATCVACHGIAGAEPIGNYPIIAGQHENYLYRTLVAYRTGERPNAVMAPLVANMSDTEMANLAAYFAAQQSPLK